MKVNTSVLKLTYKSHKNPSLFNWCFLLKCPEAFVWRFSGRLRPGTPTPHCSCCKWCSYIIMEQLNLTAGPIRRMLCQLWCWLKPVSSLFVTTQALFTSYSVSSRAVWSNACYLRLLGGLFCRGWNKNKIVRCTDSLHRDSLISTNLMFSLIQVFVG